LLGSFIKEGFSKGDKAFHIVDDRKRQDHLRRMQELGVELGPSLEKGQLEVRGWKDAHLRPGHFDQFAMLGLVQEVLTEAKRQGFPFTRWVANMGWYFEDVAGTADLVEYCARLNHVTNEHDATIICTYDCARFDASTMVDVLRTHPAAIIGGMIHENPFFVPAEELLQELAERKKQHPHVERTLA
jgi:MEDS: MEthanogen/methylotroph, DcmR Sensory domain